MTLPPELAGAVAGWLAEQGRGSNRPAAQTLSAIYRTGGSSQGIDLAAYLVARLPATYAAAARVLAELAARRAEFTPASVLDAGSGPGTASWAAAQRWPDIGRFTFLDRSAAFLALARNLAERGPGALPAAERRQMAIADLPGAVSADLVIAAYALAELPLAAIGAAALKLWQASGRVLALVEPGTPQGFARIKAARVALLQQGAVPVAPCPHAAACPVQDPDWCHFSVRLSRSRAHMHAKGATVPFEDEKFSYLILARDGGPSGGDRIIAPPRHGKPGSAYRLCAQGGIDVRHIARRDGPAYKQARKLDWGDLIGPQWEKDA